MGQSELEAALRRDGDDKAREIWTRAETEMERLRSEQQTQLQHAEHVATAERESKVMRLRASRLSEAERQAMCFRVDAEAALAHRLRQLAQNQLDKLAVSGGDQLFKALAAEIPTHQWQKVLVNQRDRQLATELFPQADIEASEEIIGGLMVRNDSSGIQIENTLGKRLQHLWPDLLPELMAELRRKAGDHGAFD